jgi:hypothetical protein
MLGIEYADIRLPVDARASLNLSLAGHKPLGR